MSTPARDVVFVDCETGGLDPAGHEAWEVAWWNLTTGHRNEFFVYVGDVAEFMGRSEPKALRVGRFLDRYPLDDLPTFEDTSDALADFRAGLTGRREMPAAEWPNHPAPVILGSKPTFDMDFLTNLFVAHRFPDPRQLPVWHHHPIDLGSYAAGVLGIELGTCSLSAESVAKLVGVKPGQHSAMGDVLSGGRAYLLLRAAAQAAAERAVPTASEWLAEFGASSYPDESGIEVALGVIPDVPF